MWRVLKQPIGDGVFQALQVLLNLALLFKKHICGRLASGSSYMGGLGAGECRPLLEVALRGCSCVYKFARAR
jgi:hypothetical protein